MRIVELIKLNMKSKDKNKNHSIAQNFTFMKKEKITKRRNKHLFCFFLKKNNSVYGFMRATNQKGDKNISKGIVSDSRMLKFTMMNNF